MGSAPRLDELDYALDAVDGLTVHSIALVTTTEAADKANVPARRVRVWAHRGLLTPVARTAAGRPLYALRQVWDVELATRRGRGPARSVVDADAIE